LERRGGRARIQDLLDEMRSQDPNPDLYYQSIYLAIQSENRRLERLGEPKIFVTSREGEARGWVRLRESRHSVGGSIAEELESQIKKANQELDDQILRWLRGMEWRRFESVFLKDLLGALGFEDVEITPPTRDGGVDARVTYRRGIVKAEAVVSAKRWTGNARVGVEEVRQLRGTPGPEDTAIIVTTGAFSSDAKEEAKKRERSLRDVYLIDGEELVRLCKEHKIGIKEIELPKLLVLDPELVQDADDEEDDGNEIAVQRLRDEMLGDPERGLSVEEVAKLSGYAMNTVRQYLCDGEKRRVLGDKIRGNEEARLQALRIVSERRSRPKSES
jgi:restriction endonuclease Mrr